MVTEENYNKISNAVYNVDSSKVEVPLAKGNHATVDIDGNGVSDLSIASTNLTPRNLFLSGGSLALTGSQVIKISPDTLRMLSSNLNMLALIEIPAMIKACQLCQEKMTRYKETLQPVSKRWKKISSNGSKRHA